jgi:hypothetical protein
MRQIFFKSKFVMLNAGYLFESIKEEFQKKKRSPHPPYPLVIKEENWKISMNGC